MQIEHALIEHGAPTLAGLKTANLFPVKMEGEDMIRSLRGVNRISVLTFFLRMALSAAG